MSEVEQYKIRTVDGTSVAQDFGAIGYSTTHKNNLHLENKKEKLCNKDKRLTDRNYACTQVKHVGQIMH